MRTKTPGISCLKIFLLTHSSLRTIHSNKNGFFLQRFIREIVDIISPFGSTTEYLAHFSKYYHLGAFISVAMQNPRKLFIFSCVLNLTSSRERILKGKNWDILYW